MAQAFLPSEWDSIHQLFDNSSEIFGSPNRTDDRTFIVGSFNIRKLGKISNRPEQAWSLLCKIVKQYDLLAVQEVMDDTSGLMKLVNQVGAPYSFILSDITGATPGKSGNKERLAFIFNNKKVVASGLASDISFDRTDIANNLYENRSKFIESFDDHREKIESWEEKKAEHKLLGKRSPTKPAIELPLFLSFIRQPHCVSFKLVNGAEEKLSFLAINAHLLYGVNKEEREWEFRALLDWLTIRAKQTDKLYHPNLILLGDCNLDFDDVPIMREDIDRHLKNLNKTVLKSKKAAKVNFPLLSDHPEMGTLKTALRQKQTYDQIAFFSNDAKLPSSDKNKEAGYDEVYDYGVVNLGNLISEALYGKKLDQLTKSERKRVFKGAEFSLSDHMPIWCKLTIT